MKEFIAMNVFERLEREWRMIDPDRPLQSEPIKKLTLPERRLRIDRFDETKVQKPD